MPAYAFDSRSIRRIRSSVETVEGLIRAPLTQHKDGRVTARLPQHRIGLVTVAVTAATYTGEALQTLGTGKMKFYKAEADGSGVSAVEDDEWDVLNLSTTSAAVGKTLLAIRAQDLQDGDASAPGWFVSPVFTDPTLQIRPIELVKTSDQTVTVDTKTYFKFQNLKNLNTDWYDAGDEDGGSPLEATNITLKLQGWYELGYSVQWAGPITSAGGTGIVMSYGTVYLEIDDPAGAGKTLLTGSGQQHAVLHDNATGASLGGNMARQILYRNDTTRAVFVRLATENGSATHARTFGASVMWAQYLGHDLDPDTTIDDLS